MKEMIIEYRKVEELIPYDKNPRLNQDAVKYVAESIKQFGFKVPIVIDKNNVIVAGHTRLKASKQLGLKEVPVIVADDLTEEQIKAFRIVDNKVSDFSLWDYEKLKEEIDKINNFKVENIEDFNLDLNFFGFEDYSVYDVLDETGLSKNENENIEKESFIITFSLKHELKPYFDNYLKTHSKEDLNAVFLNVIKGMSENGD